MASTLWIWNRQGRLNRGDSFTIAEDFYHDGAFLLRVLDDIDLDAFVSDFQEVRQRIRRGGEKWWFEVQAQAPVVIAEAAWGVLYELEALDSTLPVWAIQSRSVFDVRGRATGRSDQ